VLVSNKGLLILDHAWRSLVFETSSSFLPGGAIPAAIAVELQFVITHHLRPAPDAAALSCSNCGRQHRAEECPSFALAFKHAPDPSDPRQRRGRSSSRRAARSPSESLSTAAARRPARARVASPNSARPSPSPPSSSRTARRRRPLASSSRRGRSAVSVRPASSRTRPAASPPPPSAAIFHQRNSVRRRHGQRLPPVVALPSSSIFHCSALKTNLSHLRYVWKQPWWMLNAHQCVQ